MTNTMQDVANINVWASTNSRKDVRHTKLFAGVIVLSMLVSASLASLVPLQFSIVTVFLFAGPHNFFEFRYFVTRLPAKLGKSRRFFLLAFAGVALLTIGYLLLPVLYYLELWSGSEWLMFTGIWNSLLIIWLAMLVWIRGKQRGGRDWFWAWPAAFALCALNWLAPQFTSLAIVYCHPLVALWFLDRQIRLSQPDRLSTYRRCLLLLPFVIAFMFWSLVGAAPLADDNALAWRITQHAGAQLFPAISSHLLVTLHVFLEMLHYVIWIVAVPLLASTANIWKPKAIPLVRHPHGFPTLITVGLVFSLMLVFVLWVGFGLNYAATRDIYFAVAITHVLAEAPFLLRTL